MTARLIVFRGGPMDGECHYYEGTHLHVYERPHVPIAPQSARVVPAQPRTGLYRCANVQEIDGHWRFVWEGWE